MSFSALTSNPNKNNGSNFGIHYCGRFYPAVQDKSTGNFVVYINGIRKEYTFIELLKIQQAEQDKQEMWQRVDKGFEKQKADSNYWMNVYEAAKKKALTLCSSWSKKKEEASKEKYNQELAYRDAKRRYDQIMSTTENNKMSELNVAQRTHAKEYDEQMTVASDEKDKQEGIRSHSRSKEISAESQYLSACYSAFNEALHAGKVAMHQKVAKHIAMMS